MMGSPIQRALQSNATEQWVATDARERPLDPSDTTPVPRINQPQVGCGLTVVGSR
jgi:hypothetical protein